MPILILLIALCLSATANAKTYRWVDEDGKVHYGDRIPPKYAQQKTEQLNERGMVIKERDRPKTADELAAEKAAAEAAAEAKRKADEQERYDRFLTSTYSSQDQLILRRDEQMAILDSRIASGEKSVLQSETTLKKLLDRSELHTSKDQPVPEKLRTQIEEFQFAVDSGRNALRSMREERDRVKREFDRDLRRYLELQQAN